MALFLPVAAAAAVSPYVPPFYSYETSGSYTILTVDLDGDGLEDLVSANSDASSISVLLGNGDGTFQPKVDYPTGVYPNSLASGDLNGDGWLDLATANGWPASGYGNSISVLLGNGDGTFQPRVDYPAGDGPRSAVIAELTGDDRLDVACVLKQGSANGIVEIFPGNGDGTLGAIISWATGVNPIYLAVGDLNGDLRNDMVVANNYASSISILLGAAGGTFSPQVTYGAQSNPVSVTLGDLNADGKLDVAVGHSSSYLAVFLGNGNGTLGTRRDVNTACCSGPLLIGDYTEDGLADVVGNGTIIPGNGNGTFGARLTLGAAGNSESGGDFNRDSRRDLALIGSNRATLLLANLNRTVGTRVDAATQYVPVDLSAADMNRDGILDLVVPNSYSRTLSILPGLGNGTFGARADYPAAADQEAVATADLNGDSQLDVVTTNMGGTVSVFLGAAGGSVAARTDYPAGTTPMGLAVTDLNGDSRPDVLVADYSEHALAVLLGRSDGTLESPSEYAAGYYPVDVAAADLNGDARPDVVAANSASNTVSIFLTTSGGVPGVPVEYPVGVYPISIALSDLNHDGHPDLAVANNGSNTVSVLLGDGGGGFAPQVESGVGSYPSSVVVADLNSDGNMDLLTADEANNTISFLPGTGDGTFGRRTVSATATRPRALAAAHLDGDSRPDLVATQSYSASLGIWLNVGPTPSAVGEPGAPVVQLRVTPRANPAQGQAAFSISLPVEARVVAAIYDPAGRRVAQLMDGEMPAGPATLVWRGRGPAGQSGSSGVYFLRLTQGNRAAATKFVWLGR